MLTSLLLQALCEELTRKAADLSWENENLKRVRFFSFPRWKCFSPSHFLLIVNHVSLEVFKKFVNSLSVLWHFCSKFLEVYE